MKKMSKFSLKYCETINDYVNMYRIAKSCMSITKTHAGKIGWEIWEKKKLWPSIFYYYVPDLTGVIFKVNGKAVGRSFVYKDKYQIGPKYLSRQGEGFIPGNYISNWHYEPASYKVNYKFEFGKCLVADGYKDTLVNKMPFKTFEIPAVMLHGKPYCPFPRLDFMKYPIYISYNDKIKKFKFSPTKGEIRIIDCYDYHIWLTINAIGSAV